MAAEAQLKPIDAVPRGATEVKPDGTVVRLSKHEGTVIKLDRPATTVFIADESIADVQVKSPRLIYLYGKKPGETTLFAVDSQENVVASMAVHIAYDINSLKRAIDAVSGTSNVSVRSVERGIVIEGDVASPLMAGEIENLASGYIDPKKEEIVINRLRVTQPTQVNLRVRVAEVQRSALKQLGFNWEAFFQSSSLILGLATGFPAAVVATAPNIITGSYSNENFQFNSVLNALADEGLVTTLAEPNLTARSGENATFLAGGEFPVPVNNLNNVVTVEFKRFGVFLSFTPVVLENGQISLRVAPEVSELSAEGSVEIDGFRIPSLKTRNATTTVELGSGQSFAIAGLIRNSSRQDISKFPGLGDVPVLGQLFRSDEFLRDESELVIIITPYLVQPMKNVYAADPTQGLEPANDEDRIVKGRNFSDVTGAASAPGMLPARREESSSDAGYLLD